MKYRLTYLALFSFISLWSQQIELSGTVTVHNSKYDTGEIQYVKDVYISAPFTKPSSTDDTGKFRLDFVGLDPGTAIQLQAEKDGLEVVNGYELQEVIINRKLPLRIYLIDKGRLAQAQTELYNISKKALYARKDAMIATLRQENEANQSDLKQLEDYLGHPIEDRQQAEEELIAKIQELERRLPEFAQNLARQNLDFASDLYIEAYELFQSGEIEGAIAILDSDKLADSYEQAKADEKSGEKLVASGQDLLEQSALQIKQIADSYELKAQAYFLLFNYEESLEVYDKLIEIYRENDLSTHDYLRVLDDLALVYQDNEDIELSLQYHQELIDLAEKTLDSNSLKLASFYNNNALIHSIDGNSEEAFKYYFKSLAIHQRTGDTLNVNLATTYGNVAALFDDEGEPEKALDYQFKALKIRRDSLGEMHNSVALSYSHISDTYLGLGDYKKGVEYQKKALAIRESVYDSDHPNLAASYEQMALIYRDFGEPDKALEYMEKVVRTRESFYSPDHPIVADTYQVHARTLYEAGDYDQALTYLDKAWAMWKKNPEDFAYWQIDGYYLYGLIYRGLKQYDKAIENHQKSLELRLADSGEDSSDVGASHYRLAEVYQDMKQWNQAIEHMNQAIRIDEMNLEPGHRYLAEDYLLYANLQWQADNQRKARQYLKKAEKIIEGLDAEFQDDFQEDVKDLIQKLKDEKK